MAVEESLWGDDAGIALRLQAITDNNARELALVSGSSLADAEHVVYRTGDFPHAAAGFGPDGVALLAQLDQRGRAAFGDVAFVHLDPEALGLIEPADPQRWRDVFTAVHRQVMNEAPSGANVMAVMPRRVDQQPVPSARAVAEIYAQILRAAALLTDSTFSGLDEVPPEIGVVAEFGHDYFPDENQLQKLAKTAESGAERRLLFESARPALERVREALRHTPEQVRAARAECEPARHIAHPVIQDRLQSLALAETLDRTDGLLPFHPLWVNEESQTYALYRRGEPGQNLVVSMRPFSEIRAPIRDHVAALHELTTYVPPSPKQLSQVLALDPETRWMELECQSSESLAATVAGVRAILEGRHTAQRASMQVEIWEKPTTPETIAALQELEAISARLKAGKDKDFLVPAVDVHRLWPEDEQPPSSAARRWADRVLGLSNSMKVA